MVLRIQEDHVHLCFMMNLIFASVSSVKKSALLSTAVIEAFNIPARACFAAYLSLSVNPTFTSPIKHFQYTAESLGI